MAIFPIFLHDFNCSWSECQSYLSAFTSRQVLTRINFLKILAKGMCKPDVVIRITNQKTSFKLRDLAAERFSVEFSCPPERHEGTSYRKRCTICPSKKDSKIDTFCSMSIYLSWKIILWKLLFWNKMRKYFFLLLISIKISGNIDPPYYLCYTFFV